MTAVRVRIKCGDGPVVLSLVCLPRVGELVVSHDGGVRSTWVVRAVEHRAGDELVVLHCEKR